MGGRSAQPRDGVATGALAVVADGLQATTNRAALLAAHSSAEAPPNDVSVIEAEVADESPAPPETAPIMASVPSLAAVPPLVALVALGLAALGCLALYPLTQAGFSSIGSLFSTDPFERALGALVWYVLGSLVAMGARSFALAVGLLRGSRLTQLLTCVVSGALVLGSLASVAQAENGDAGLTRGLGIAIVLVGLAVIGALTMVPGQRSYFAQDDQRPLGVALASAVAIYFGTVAAISGMLLMVCGAVGVKYVLWGLALFVTGTALVLTSRGLQAGRIDARILATAAFLAMPLLALLISHSVGQANYFGVLLYGGLAGGALVGLWNPESSKAHFASPANLPELRRPARIGLAVLLLGGLVFAIVGFASSAQKVDYSSVDEGAGVAVLHGAS